MTKRKMKLQILELKANIRLLKIRQNTQEKINDIFAIQNETFKKTLEIVKGAINEK